MNIKLFNDNGCETLNEKGHVWSDLVHEAIKPLVNKAIENDISLRDLTTIVMDEITCLTAENRILKGVKEQWTFSKT